MILMPLIKNFYNCYWQHFKFTISSLLMFVGPSVCAACLTLTFSQKNQPGRIIVVYDEDERIAPQAATTLVQRGYDNLFMLSGGENNLNTIIVAGGNDGVRGVDDIMKIMFGSWGRWWCRKLARVCKYRQDTTQTGLYIIFDSKFM